VAVGFIGDDFALIEVFVAEVVDLLQPVSSKGGCGGDGVFALVWSQFANQLPEIRVASFLSAGFPGCGARQTAGDDRWGVRSLSR
jgi:hypothetical protein